MRIWNWVIEFLGNILNKLLEIVRGSKTPSSGPKVGDAIDPIKYKYGDVENKEYLNNLIQTIDDYKLYILITIGVLAVGILTYTFWNSFPRLRGGNGGGGSDSPDDVIPSPIPSDPSSGKDIGSYPDGYLTHFSKKLGELSAQVKNRAQQLYSSAHSPLAAAGEREVIHHLLRV